MYTTVQKATTSFERLLHKSIYLKGMEQVQGHYFWVMIHTHNI